MDYKRASRISSKDDSSFPTGGSVFTTVVLGQHVMRPWYSSSYPKQAIGSSTKLFVCEHCFKYSAEVSKAVGHIRFCNRSQSEPLGVKFYDEANYAIYQVDGEENPLFCQNLSLFGKLFLGTKSICYDVEAFHFYTLVEKDSRRGQKHIVGFFSKEKLSWDNNNLACILVFPPYQKRGFGHLLISFSYEVSKIDGEMGSPEKPLSEMGRIGYEKYWCAVIARRLIECKGSPVTVRELSEYTYISLDDVLGALRAMDVKVDQGMAVTAFPVALQLVNSFNLDKSRIRSSRNNRT